MVGRPPIRVLGLIEVETDLGGTVSLGLRQEILLAVLAANAGAVVSAETLTDSIWGDDVAVSRAGALHTLVSRLRPQLPEASLVTQGHGYVLANDPEILDIARFDELMLKARESPVSQALDSLDEALALWRGRSFGLVADRAGVQPRAIEMDELHVVAAERLARLLIDVGRSGEAVARLDRLIEQHPLRETPVALAMEALVQTGRQTEALRYFSALRERLVVEAGLEPSAKLRQVEEDVLNDRFASDSPQQEVQAAAPGNIPLRLRTRMVERRPGEPIAYATFGSGPSLVFMPGWISSLDAFADGTDPRGVLLSLLARHFSVTVFDRYGTGLSKAPNPDFAVEASADEVRAVLSVIDGPSTIFASSAAGPAALLAAAGNPAVQHIVLMCTYANGPGLFTKAQNRESLIEVVEQSWGMGSRILADMIVPGIDAVTRAVFARFQRRTASPEVAAGYIRQLFDADVTSVLARIEQPCLVVHYRDDPAIPYSGSHQLVLGIRDTELQPLEGPFHTPPPEHAETIADSVRRFVAGV